MQYELNWNRIKTIKQHARKFLKTHRGYWFASILRAMFTLIFYVTTYSWFMWLLFDDRLKVYNDPTTKSVEHMCVIAIAILGRCTMEYYIEQTIYEQRTIPLRFYLYRLWRLFITTAVGVAGMILTDILKAPIFIGRLWFLVTILFYVTTKVSTFGSSWMYLRTLDTRSTYKKVYPQGFREWRKIILFYISFIGHDLINLFTLGLYGVWYIPYKKTVERFVFEKGI